MESRPRPPPRIPSRPVGVLWQGSSRRALQSTGKPARPPQAVLVFDKFHIVRHLMAAVDQVRRDEVREKGPAHKALLYKTRFIWLKNPWNLTERQALRLGALERLNLKINRAYLLKELFRDVTAVPAGFYHRGFNQGSWHWGKPWLTVRPPCDRPRDLSRPVTGFA